MKRGRRYIAARKKAPAYSRKSRKKRIGLTAENRIVLICAAAIIIFLLVLFIRALLPKSSAAKINAKDVAAFRIPYSALMGIFELSEKYSISFSKLVTVYCLDNKFFPEGSQTVVDMVEIERRYILNYDSIDSYYPMLKYAEYYRIFNSVFSEVKAFPVQSLYLSEDYMYGNSYGSERSSGEIGIHYGTDILDRENIKGRLKIVSITDGYVSETSWNEKNGYYIDIVTANNTMYRYAHFDSIATGLKKGDIVNAGQFIGNMGNSGMSGNSDSSNFPVHLHVEIIPHTSLTRDTFRLNPYYILKYAEWRFSGLDIIVD